MRCRFDAGPLWFLAAGAHGASLLASQEHSALGSLSPSSVGGLGWAPGPSLPWLSVFVCFFLESPSLPTGIRDVFCVYSVCVCVLRKRVVAGRARVLN